MNAKFHVPFDTAQKLIEKGYSGENDYFWDANHLKPRRVASQKRSGIQIFSMNNNAAYMLENKPFDSKCVVECTAPTYHEVVDWLYGKKICITCHPAYCYYGQYNGFRYEMQTYDEDDYPDDVYCTREEALNAGILAALEML